jgi:hypothetical protein
MDNLIHQENNLEQLLKDCSLSSEAKVKQIVSDEKNMEEIKKCLEKANPKIPVFKSNKIKFIFSSLSSDDGRFDDLYMYPKVEKEAVHDLLSDFLKVERVKQINENEFEVELKNRNQAQMVFLAFDELELEELGLKIKVEEVKLKMKSKLRNKKMFKPYLGINKKLGLPRKSSHVQGEVKSKMQIRHSQTQMMKNPMLPLMQNKFQYGMVKDGIPKFRNGSFNGNIVPMPGYPEGKIDFMRMQYQMVSYNMMNTHNKNQMTKSKQMNRDLTSKNRFTEQEVLLAGIVLISAGKNKPNTNKFTCRYNVMIENDKNFQVAKKIIGSKGCNMKSIIDSVPQQYSNFNQKRSKQDALKLRLRGKGSGFKEGPDQKESDEPLHLCISAKCESVYLDSCKRVERLLNKIYEDYILYLEKSGNKDDSFKLQNPKKFRFQKYEGNSHMFK